MKLDLFSKVGKVMELVDKAKDLLSILGKLQEDTDGNGKSQLQDICESAELAVHATYDDIKGTFDSARARGAAVVKLVLDLKEHVLKDEK